MEGYSSYDLVKKGALRAFSNKYSLDVLRLKTNIDFYLKFWYIIGVKGESERPQIIKWSVGIIDYLKKFRENLKNPLTTLLKSAII